MIRKKVLLSITIPVILLFTNHAWSGNLYRYKDENGVIALSRTLPPASAQQGYDILDDKTMRLIERIEPAPTAEQIAEMEKQALIEADRRKQAEAAAKEQEQQRQQQAIYDRTLLITYESEADLIQARDKLIDYRQAQIQTHKAKLPELEDHLVQLQKQAADRELSGHKISENMAKRLEAAEQEINLRHQAIEELNQEISELNQSFAKDQKRLQQLLGTHP